MFATSRSFADCIAAAHRESFVGPGPIAVMELICSRTIRFGRSGEGNGVSNVVRCLLCGDGD